MQDTSFPKKTILLIEDDTFLLNMYREKFVNEGLHILTASDGDEGLEIALNQDVDMIVLDLMLPKLSGEDLLIRLRKKNKNIPVIVLTNLSREDQAEGFTLLGVKEYLVKANLTPSQLVDKVKGYLI